MCRLEGLIEKVVYYGVTNHPDRGHGLVNGREPQLAIKEFMDKTEELRFLKCPPYRDNMNNLFAVSSWFSLELKVDENGGLSADVPQKFLDSYIVTHSDKRKVYQLLQSTMFIAKDDSLMMTQESASMTDNSFTRDCGTVSGVFDIGKYFRFVVCPFWIRSGVDRVRIKEAETLYYLRFHTKKKIKFVPFFMSPKFESLVRHLGFINSNTNSWKPMKYYYKLFKEKNLKKLLIKEIEQNLL